MNLILVGVIMGIVLSGILILAVSVDEDEEENKVFQGPVRPGDDEDYFRKTGITRSIEKDG